MCQLLSFLLPFAFCTSHSVNQQLRCQNRSAVLWCAAVAFMLWVMPVSQLCLTNGLRGTWEGVMPGVRTLLLPGF